MADNLSHSPILGNNEPLSDHITTEINKYLQAAAEKHDVVLLQCD